MPEMTRCDRRGDHLFGLGQRHPRPDASNGMRTWRNGPLPIRHLSTGTSPSWKTLTWSQSYGRVWLTVGLAADAEPLEERRRFGQIRSATTHDPLLAMVNCSNGSPFPPIGPHGRLMPSPPGQLEYWACRYTVTHRQLQTDTSTGQQGVRPSPSNHAVRPPLRRSLAVPFRPYRDDHYRQPGDRPVR